MLINLNDLHINFDLENDIPYFQVLDRNKLRLDFSDIEIKDINFVIVHFFQNILNLLNLEKKQMLDVILP